MPFAHADLATTRERFDALSDAIRPLVHNEPDRALPLAEEAVSLSHRMGDKERGQALFLLGNAQLWMANYSGAFDSLSDALRYANDADDALTAAIIHNSIGVVHQKVGDNASALAAFQIALTQFRELNDTRRQAAALHNIGVEYRVMGNLAEARNCHEQVLGIDRVSGDREGEGRTLVSLGNVSYFENDFDTAQTHYETALDIARSVGDMANVAQCLENLAQTHILRGDFTQAEQCLSECQTMCDTVNLPGLRATVLGGYGRLFFERQQYEAARESLAKCVAEAQAHDLRRVLSEAYEMQVKVEEATGNWRDALEAFHRYHELYTTMQTEDAERKARTISVQMQIAQSRWEAQQHRSRSETLAQENAVLVEAAHTDKLTGLPNRRFFEPRFHEALHRAHTDAVPFSLAVLDIDFFKKINDTLSHVGGDAVLKQVGAILRENCRATHDVAARFGGEEFVLLLNGVTADVAFARCEQIRKTIEEYPWRTVHADLAGVTISAGVCDALTHAGADSEALFAAADALLYEAKRGGRNQVRCG